MIRSEKAPRYRVKEGGDTFGGIAEKLYGTEEVADRIAAHNSMAPDATLEEGFELKLPPRAFRQKGPPEKGNRQSIIPIAVHKPQLCWVSFDEELPTKDSVSSGTLEGKWVYVVADGDIAVTVDAKPDGHWAVDNALFEETQDVTDGWVPLRPDKEYRFFISPIELSDGAKQELLDNMDELNVPALEPVSLAKEVVTLRDPFAWTVELHAQRYHPCIEKWNEWRYDKSRMAELFIASVLKQLIGKKDDLSIEGHLEKQPDEWLQEYERQEAEIRRPADEAMAEIAIWATSWEHRIIERAAFDNGEGDLHMAVVQWASFTYGAAETPPGRMLVQYAVETEDRLPRRYILAEASTELDLAFKEHRFLANAAMGLMSDLAPGIAEILRSRPDKWEVLQLWLEKLDGEKPLKGNYKRVKKALDKGRRITKKVIKDQRKITKLLRKAEESRAAVVKVPKTLARAEKLTKAYDRNLGAAARTAGFGIEVVNLAMAVSELSGGASVLKAISATGAAADFGVVVVESFEILAREGAKTGLKMAGAVLGIISGVCDCTDFFASASSSGGKHDYNAMVGHGISAVGAAGVAVGSGIALAELVAGGAVVAGATGVGLIVVLIGAALIAIGSVLAAWLTDNAYEEFAEHSFLGESAGKEGDVFPWAPARIQLPASEREDEMRALIALLSNFRTDALSWDSVSIYPGYYRDGDKIELYVHHRYNNFKLGPLKFRAEIDLTTGDMRQTAGNRPLADSCYVRYDDTGRAKEIKMMIEEGNPRPDLLLPFKSQMMWVRLISKDGFAVPPRDASGKDVWHTSYYLIDSLIRTSTSGSSLDTDHRATSDNNPPPRDLDPIT